MLFLTNVDKDALWDCYLNSFPEEERQSHNCNNCKHYIRHYGRVVAIKDNKVVTMWENLQLDEPCAYGILIHSMWGEESEDKVFEEYKRINNLML